MEKLKIEMLQTSVLIPYIRNSRTHSEFQVTQIAGSINEFGFTNPVLIDEKNMIIAGHGRVKAAQLLNILQIPCIRLKNLTDTQKRAYVLADNKLTLNAGWDDELLKIEIEELKLDNFNLNLTGFSESEIHNINKIFENTTPNDFKEFNEEIETDYQCPKCKYEWSGKQK